MIELTYVGSVATVTAGANIPFNTAMKSGCNERYRVGSSIIRITRPGRYLVSASANVASTTAGDVVLLGITLDGETVNGSIMSSSPATALAYNSVSSQTFIDVYPGCCATVSLANVGATEMSVNNQNLMVTRIGGGNGYV